MTPTSRAPPHARPYQEAFARLAEEGVDAGRIAEVAVSSWRALDASLAPIIGQRGVDALFLRSLFLLREGRPWLTALHEEGFRPGSAPAFKATFAHQERLVAASTAGALLETFHGLLVALVGSDLSGRLLDPAKDASP